MLEDITGEEIKRQFKTNKVLRYVTIGVGILVIENKKVVENHTTISMEALPKAIYFLKVARANQTVKTFKIIKQ